MFIKRCHQGSEVASTEYEKLFIKNVTDRDIYPLDKEFLKFIKKKADK